VFHFVRQQYGWVMLYRAKAGESGTWSRRLDAATIYIATLHPLAMWHAHLPRSFRWMIDGDFAPLPEWLPLVTGPIWASLLIAYFARSLWQGLKLGHWNPGKDLVVATTALCWYIGIVVFYSDYAFHGDQRRHSRHPVFCDRLPRVAALPRYKRGDLALAAAADFRRRRLGACVRRRAVLGPRRVERSRRSVR
jgi:hypothetical protein